MAASWRLLARETPALLAQSRRVASGCVASARVRRRMPTLDAPGAQHRSTAPVRQAHTAVFTWVSHCGACHSALAPESAHSRRNRIAVGTTRGRVGRAAHVSMPAGSAASPVPRLLLQSTRSFGSSTESGGSDEETDDSPVRPPVDKAVDFSDLDSGPWQKWGGYGSASRIMSLVNRKPRPRRADGRGRTKRPVTEEEAWLRGGAYEAYGAEPSRGGGASRPSPQPAASETSAPTTAAGDAVAQPSAPLLNDVAEVEVMTSVSRGHTVRVSTAHVSPDHLEALVDTYADVAAGAYRVLDGFRGAQLLVDRDARPCLVQSVTSWSSDSHYAAAVRDARYHAAMKTLAAFFREPPSSVHLSVAHVVRPARAGHDTDANADAKV